MTRQPVLFIPHGGGPCFFMDDPHHVWTSMEDFLRSVPELLPEPPSAILIVSGHWETEGFLLTGARHPELIYDYYGFPPHTYQLRYDAPGSPELAAEAALLLTEAGLTAGLDNDRGLDHGAFVPLKVAFPDAHVPVVELSVDRRLDPSLHIAAGRALMPLRDRGVLIIGAGMSFHNLRAYGDPRFTPISKQFDDWLTESVSLNAVSRGERLKAWSDAPGALLSHPQSEHLLPLMVAAGAAEGTGERIYSDLVLETANSAFRFN
jgi:aromatic ring-opening dioxygenase catalytic subunit (LigB family)